MHRRPICIYFSLSFAVYESFKDYIATETMDGENKYDAGEQGMQVCSSEFLSDDQFSDFANSFIEHCQ